MKKQTTASFLCVFLVSTIAHEYLHHQHPQSQNRVANNHHNSKHLSHLTQKRDGSDSDEVCGWQCPPPDGNSTSNEDIKIVINAKTNIVGLLNVTSNINIIFDFNTKLIQTANGTDGKLIMIDVKGQIGSHVTNKKSSLFWLSENLTFEAYVNSLTSLKPVLEEALKVGNKFNVASPGKKILTLMATKSLVNFGVVIGRDVKKDYSNVFVVLLDITSRFNSVLTGPLAGLFEYITSTTFTVNVGLEVIVERFEGFAYDTSKIDGGLGTLIKHHIKTDLQKILGAKSGLESLTYVLNSHADGGLDVVTAIGGHASIELVFDVVVHYSGASSEGYSAFVRVVGLVVLAANGNVTTDVLIDALVKYSINAKDSEKLYDQFNASLKILLKALIKINTGGRIDSTVADLKKLINGTLVIREVNIADVAKILARNGDNVAIDLVVGVLVALKSALNVSQSIPALILYILTELNTSSGITIIINLFPNIKIDENIGNSGDGNLLQTILKNVNIRDIIGSGFDIVKILEKLPVIGDIWVSISVSLDTQSKGSIKLSVVIKSNGAADIVKNILSILGSALHIDLTKIGGGSGGFSGHYQIDEKHFHKHENRHIEHLKHSIQEKIHHHNNNFN